MDINFEINALDKALQRVNDALCREIEQALIEQSKRFPRRVITFSDVLGEAAIFISRRDSMECQYTVAWDEATLPKYTRVLQPFKELLQEYVGITARYHNVLYADREIMILNGDLLP